MESWRRQALGSDQWETWTVIRVCGLPESDSELLSVSSNSKLGNEGLKQDALASS